jgi:AcrR family transcriptional regulator
MGTRERMARESENLKRRILKATKGIIIAAIYHYFNNKEEIVSLIVAEGYCEIIGRLKRLRIVAEDPEETFLSMARSYVELALKNRNLFRVILLEDVGAANRKVWMLEEGIGGRRESVAALARLIGIFVENGAFKPVHLETAAVAAWCALHGLLVGGLRK